MSDDEAIETAAIDSVLGRSFDPASWRQRPFRAPHHTASAVALVGGGSDPRPGEISRAHNGVLFLDELPEFSRHVLEVLREPLESGQVTISRAGRQADYPARFQLVAAMNPCPCGYLGDPGGECSCSAERVARYRGRISGPLLDRIDIHLVVQRPHVASLRSDAPAEESSSDVARRVAAARTIQSRRAGVCNSVLDGERLAAAFRAEDESRDLLDGAAEKLALSARAYQRVQRVARTIADLAGEETIARQHMAEALALRIPG
jgi:magnesium chelatase family protein